MSKSETHVSILVLLAVILFPQIVAAQSPQKPRKAVVKKEGWLIPGRDDFKQVSQVAEKKIEGVAIIQKLLKAPAEIIVDLDGNRVNPWVKRKPDVRHFSVRNFSIYESKGRVFAYGVDLVPILYFKWKGGWGKTYAAAMHNLFYVDGDGDGIFESRYDEFPLRQVPDWVRRNV